MMDPSAVMTNAPDLVGKVTDAVSGDLSWIFAFFGLELVIALGMAFLDKKIFHGRGGEPPPPLPDEDPFDGHDF